MRKISDNFEHLKSIGSDLHDWRPFKICIVNNISFEPIFEKVIFYCYIANVHTIYAAQFVLPLVPISIISILGILGCGTLGLCIKGKECAWVCVLVWYTVTVTVTLRSF